MSTESIRQQPLTSSNQKFWKVVSSSIAGTSHQKKGLPCQDAHHWQLHSDNVLVAAVADGAGSAAKSEIGADLAVNKAVETVLQQDLLPNSEDEAGWKSLLVNALEAAKLSVEAEANTRQVPVRDLASTLLIAIATPELVVTAQIGDGAIVISDKQNEIIALTTPQSGEYINQTTFLVSSNAIDTAQTNIWQGNIANLAMFSDGLQMLALKMPAGTPHTPFFNPLFSFISQINDLDAAIKELKRFLKSPRVAQRSDDDLTILLASFQE